MFLSTEGGTTLATISLIISLIALGFGIATFVRRGITPLVSQWKAIHTHLTLGGAAPIESIESCLFHVVVQALGQGKTTIVDVGLAADNGPGNVSVGRLRAAGVKVAGPELPLELGEGGYADWRIETVNMASEFPEDDMVRAWAHVPAGRRTPEELLTRRPRESLRTIKAATPEYPLRRP